MKTSFPAEFLRCPNCHADRTLRLTAAESDDREVREGTLMCERCHHSFAVHRGVGELMLNPPAHVLAEAAGLERFAEFAQNSGWDREMILKLPYVEHGYWYAQAISMEQLLSTIEFKAGQSLLDVGSNTCWATNIFAERGLRAIALDIATVEYQGLYTADFFFEAGKPHFERVLGTMNDIPVASDSLDYVLCCQVLHHNNLAELRQAMREIHRVLKPGGKLLMVNETLKYLRDPVGVNLPEGVDQYEGHEHAHWALQYRIVAERAGFSTKLLEPAYKAFFQGPNVNLGPGSSFLDLGRAVLRFSAQKFRPTRRAYLMWLNHVVGGVSFGMIATKR